MKLFLIALIFGLPAFGQDPAWPKEPDAFVGVPFNSTEAAAKTKVRFGICLPVTPQERSCSLSFVLVDDAIGPLTLSLFFTFSGDQLVYISGNFPSSDYARVKEIFTEKYGKPLETVPETVQTKTGAKYENETLRWNGKTVNISLARYDDSIDTGSLRVYLKTWMQDKMRRDAEAKKQGASKL
jgi:hypothetical protein